MVVLVVGWMLMVADVVMVVVLGLMVREAEVVGVLLVV